MKALKLHLLSLGCLLFLVAQGQAQSIYGSALLFNYTVTNEYVTVPNFGTIIPTNEITVEFWAYAIGFATKSAFMLSPDQGNNRFNAHIDYGSNPGQTYWDFGNISGAGRVFTTSPPDSVDNWVHYALVASQSANYMRIYTNGVLQISQTGMTPFVRGNYNLQIGGPGFPFSGILDELRVWSVARTPAQIRADLYSLPTGNESNLVVYYKFDNASGLVATNSATATGAAFNGTLNNGPTWVASTIPLVVNVVTNTADSGPGTLRTVVANAPSGAIITFSPALSGQVITLTNGPIILSSNVIIDAGALANGIQINPNYTTNIFTVNNATVVFNSLTLTNGNGNSSKGGAIQNNSGTVTINNCLFTGNAAYYGDGGAIANILGTMTLNNCTFMGNFADCPVPQSHTTGGGAIYNDQAHLTVNSCSFIGNSAINCLGGGAILNEAAYPIMVNNTTFVGNVADNGNSGGGAISDQSGAAVAVNNCTFVGNSANNSGGGGIYTSGDLNLTNSIICSNLANTGAEVYCGGHLALINFVIGPGASYPSAIYYHYTFASQNEVDVADPLLAPLGNYGGPTPTLVPLPGSPAIDAGVNSVTSFLTTDQRGQPRKTGANVDIGAVEFQPGDTNAANCIVTTASDSGSGSLRYAAFLANLGISNRISFVSSLSGQTILLTSGQIVLSTNLTVDASSLAKSIQINGNNQSRIFEITNGATVTLNSLTITNGNNNNDVTYGGGGILNFGRLTISNCTVAGNKAVNGGDGGDGGGIEDAGISLTVNNSIISGNVAAAGNGGGIVGKGTLTVSNCTVTGNQAHGNGGGIDLEGTSMTVNYSTISGNQSDNNGGGIFAAAATFINNCSIVGNIASDSLGGGGICNAGVTTMNSTTITSNQSDGSYGGGGILNLALSALNLTNCIFYSNSAFSGPEIYNYAGSVAVAYCLLGPEGLGAIYNNSGTIISTNSTVAVNPILAPLGNYGGLTQTMPPEPGSPAIGAGNVAAAMAAGLTTDQRGLPRIVGGKVDIGAVEVQSGQSYPIVENTLDNGPGSLRQIVSNSLSGATITFDPSLAGQTITLTSGQIVLSNSVTIDGSDGTTLTNGIRINGNGNSRIFQVNSGAVVALIELTLTNGYPGSGNSGGAILNQPGTFLELIVCTLAGNSSSQGGAIENSGTCVLIECTVAGNLAVGNGGAIDNNQGPLQLIQCTLNGNVSQGGVGGAVANYLATLAITNSILAGNFAGSGGDIYNFGSSTINAGGSNLVQSSVNGGTLNGAGTFISKAPMLAALGNYGGPTPTMLPQRGSPAINGGSTAAISGAGFDLDQRKYPRFSGTSVDIGAVEVQTAATPFFFGGFGRMATGTVQFSLTNVPYGSFTVFASTNVAAPFNTWSNLGSIAESPAGSGVYPFTDVKATNFSRRFYRVSSP